MFLTRTIPLVYKAHKLSLLVYKTYKLSLVEIDAMSLGDIPPNLKEMYDHIFYYKDDYFSFSDIIKIYTVQSDIVICHGYIKTSILEVITNEKLFKYIYTTVESPYVIVNNNLFGSKKRVVSNYQDESIIREAKFNIELQNK